MAVSVINGFSFSYRFQHLDQDLILVPLKNSVIGALSLKNLDIVYELDTSSFEEQPKLGEVMAIKPINCFEKNYVLASYESGHTGLWDLRERRVVDWLKIEECPMAINFDDYWMRGVIGSPNDKLEVRFLLRFPDSMLDVHIWVILTHVYVKFSRDL